MGILLAFAPFIIFALIDRIGGPTAGLVAGALVSLALLLRDLLTHSRSPKILEIGTSVLFCGLAGYALLKGIAFSVIGVRLWVDSGLLLLVLGSIASGQPFTLQYAREQVPPEFWNSPQFKRTNFIISGVWALAFATMVVAELALLYVPTLTPKIGIISIIIALVCAVKFTSWYPTQIQTPKGD